MFRRRQSRIPHTARRTPRFVAAVAAALTALVPGVASAQALPTPERNEVMLWTVIVSVLALAVCGVGFAYRRMRGMDHPTPDEISMLGGHGHGGEHHDEGHGEAEATQAPAAAHH